MPALVGLLLALGTGMAAIDAAAHAPPPAAALAEAQPGLVSILDRLSVLPALGDLGMDPLSGMLPQGDGLLPSVGTAPQGRSPAGGDGAQTNLKTLTGGDTGHAAGFELHIPKTTAGWLLGVSAYDSDADGEVRVQLNGTAPWWTSPRGPTPAGLPDIN